MHLADNGVNSWLKNVARILRFCNLEYLLYTSDLREIDYQINNLEKRFKDIFNIKWAKEREGFSVNSKLELLVSLKEKFELSNYLKENINFTYKSAISKMRLSAHKFPIETERYLSIPREGRICPLGCNAIGDEYHYLFSCYHPSIQRVQVPITRSLTILNPELNTMETKIKGKFLLNNSHPQIINLVGKLCHSVQSIFKEITW